MNNLPFDTIEARQRDPHYLRPGLHWAVDTPAARTIREFTDDVGSGCMAGTRCDTPGHYIHSTRWGYLSTGAKDELEAYDWAAARLPNPPQQGRSYLAGGEVYELRAIHPLTLDLYFVGTQRSFWVKVSDYKDHFIPLPLDFGGQREKV